MGLRKLRPDNESGRTPCRDHWIVLPVLFSFLFLTVVLPSIAGSITGFVEIRGNHIEVEIADTSEKAMLGLSHRSKLPDRQGMFFMFPDKADRTFWMKDMSFDLDIIWIDDDRVVKIDRYAKAEGAFPSRVYSSVIPVNRVLEINAGLSDRWGIRAGDPVRFIRK
jgi:hypothetical protein